MLKIVFLFLSFVALFAQDKALETLFEKYELSGTMVIQSLDTKTTYIYNHQRAITQLLPASTFKIPHTLIALNEKLIKNEHDIIKWDGEKRFLNVWNQDQTIKSAFAYSCVWCYQYFASQLSLQTYESYLKKLSYGNEKTGKKLTTFWLDGDLRISAMEQIDVLRHLYLNELPFLKKHQELLKYIMMEEKNESYQLFSKTGWATSVKEKHGWYVGFITTKKDVWLFATNLLIDDFTKLHLRKDITLEALQLKSIMNSH